MDGRAAAYVFQGVRQSGMAFVQRRCFAEVLGAHQRPEKTDRGQGITDSRYHGNICFTGGAFFSCLQIDDVHTAAIRRQVGDRPIKG